MNTPFWGVSCPTAEQGKTHLDMKCPYGFKIEIIKAQYGRRNKWNCAQNGQPGKEATCGNSFVNMTSDVTTKCGGKSECSYHGVSEEDPCPGISKYTEIRWTCVSE